MPPSTSSIGKLSPNVVCHTLVDQTIEFVWASLSLWKDDPDRPYVKAEEDLNGQFHDFLSLRATHEFPMIFFRHEQRQKGQRKVDLAAKPTNPVVIHGIRYSPYQPIITIEGKRLPAPQKNRKREYVTGENGKISGGIQRYKLGEHGGEHDVAIIIGYVQEQSLQYWYTTVNSWITDLVKTHPDEWGIDEKLSAFQIEHSAVTAKSISKHPRIIGSNTQKIRILHFWISLQIK